MCGKFTAQTTWLQVVDFSQPLTGEGGGEGGGDGEVYTYRVNGMLPVIIIWDVELGKRRIVPMRWGFPDRRDWRRPQPIHAHAETVDELRTFRDAFNDGPDGHALTLLGPWRRQREAAQLTSGPTLHHYGLIASM